MHLALVDDEEQAPEQQRRLVQVHEDVEAGVQTQRRVVVVVKVGRAAGRKFNIKRRFRREPGRNKTECSGFGSNTIKFLQCFGSGSRPKFDSEWPEMDKIDFFCSW